MMLCQTFSYVLLQFGTLSSVDYIEWARLSKTSFCKHQQHEYTQFFLYHKLKILVPLEESNYDKDLVDVEHMASLSELHHVFMYLGLIVIQFKLN